VGRKRAGGLVDAGGEQLLAVTKSEGRGAYIHIHVHVHRHIHVLRHIYTYSHVDCICVCLQSSVQYRDNDHECRKLESNVVRTKSPQPSRGSEV
jgi:hypothetical protein